MSTEPETATVAAPSASFFQALVRPYGDRRWDIFLRGTALAAGLLIPIAIYFPDYAALVWLAVVGLPANGPLGPVIPTAFEPLIMEAAKYHRPLEVTAVALAVYMYMEYLNWFIYRWVLSFKKLEKVRMSKWTQKGVDYFSRSPFLTIVVFAVTPFPFWIARCLAILNRYSIRRFMIATAIGRLPRLYLYAWLGEKLMVPSVALFGFAIGGALLLISWRLLKGKAVLPEVGE